MKKYIIPALSLLAFACVLWAATGDETATLTRQSQDRLRVNPRYKVWDAIVTAVWDDDDTGDVTQAITVNGIIQKIVFVAPDGTNAVTYQLVIRDDGDNTIFDSGEVAEAATYTYNIHEPVTGTIDVIVGPSGAIGATNPDAVVTLRGI
jgi:hypothetical protein